MASSDNASVLLRHVIFNGFKYQVCKIVDRRIEFGESFEVETTFPFRHLFCDQFFSFMYTYLEVQDDVSFIYLLLLVIHDCLVGVYHIRFEAEEENSN
jgi:hypothetical protein